MSKKKLKRKKIAKKLYAKNRLVILNEDTFEEIFSLRLTLMNVFVVASLGAILIIFVTTFIIAFTPLREFIPGYTSGKMKREATELALKSDSIQKAIRENQIYLSAIKKALTGEVEAAKLNKDSIVADSTRINEQSLQPSAAELKIRNATTTKPIKK
ncbi:peptidase [Flavobacterium silvaticum]|uniref:Peptidase n=1 Tax=Flavobacterium silvaticum TaxID=1852020 RepID=A0A972FS74_9FLAO|nr:peptidase [Flavobacterium silvaticum]NMH28399.1 peptidase [Flavobacterium silvaticum]